jgi:thioredoxin-like negative regulator of GroEL
MDKETARLKFKEADELFKSAKYEDALIVLKELDAAFPGSRHIMYPMARCLAKLKYLQAAVDLCDAIYEKFQYEKARELRNRITNVSTPTLNFDNLDIDFDNLHETTQELEAESDL